MLELQLLELELDPALKVLEILGPLFLDLTIAIDFSIQHNSIITAVRVIIRNLRLLLFLPHLPVLNLCQKFSISGYKNLWALVLESNISKGFIP